MERYFFWTVDKFFLKNEKYQKDKNEPKISIHENKTK